MANVAELCTKTLTEVAGLIKQKGSLAGRVDPGHARTH